MSLQLARRPQQAIMINDDIKITVGRINQYSVMLMIDAPKDVLIDRMEIYSKKHPELEYVMPQDCSNAAIKRQYVEAAFLPRNGKNSPLIKVYGKNKFQDDATDTIKNENKTSTNK